MKLAQQIAAAIAARRAGQPACDQLSAAAAADDVDALLQRSGEDWHAGLAARYRAPGQRIAAPRALTADEEADLAATLDRLTDGR